jgi:hypothetical protein
MDRAEHRGISCRVIVALDTMHLSKQWMVARFTVQSAREYFVDGCAVWHVLSADSSSAHLLSAVPKVQVHVKGTSTATYYTYKVHDICVVRSHDEKSAVPGTLDYGVVQSQTD